MIKITAELISDRTGRKYQLGTVEIVNDTTGDEKVGSYDITLTIPGRMIKRTSSLRIEGFKREQGAWVLIYQALKLLKSKGKFLVISRPKRRPQ